jgi:nucleoside-diphosphate-sugar epimerase
MKILVTGHRGYIGSHLISLLTTHEVWGCDLELFDECQIAPVHAVPCLGTDFRKPAHL